MAVYFFIKTETIVSLDTVVKSIAEYFFIKTETLVETDTVIKSILKSIIDQVVIIDLFSRLFVFIFSESINVIHYTEKYINGMLIVFSEYINGMVKKSVSISGMVKKSVSISGMVKKASTLIGKIL